MSERIEKLKQVIDDWEQQLDWGDQWSERDENARADILAILSESDKPVKGEYRVRVRTGYVQLLDGEYKPLTGMLGKTERDNITNLANLLNFLFTRIQELEETDRGAVSDINILIAESETQKAEIEKLRELLEETDIWVNEELDHKQDCQTRACVSAKCTCDYNNYCDRLDAVLAPASPQGEELPGFKDVLGIFTAKHPKHPDYIASPQGEETKEERL